MPRANRVQLDGHICHITHRCHDRDFLFRFRKDRNFYRELIRREHRQFNISLLSYCITCNHVHLLLRSKKSHDVGRFMQRVEGAMGQAYNLRRRRTGAFWADRYHATLVEDGHHLWSCFRYIDLNMVRAGVVQHPRDWAWTAWRELVGERRHHRLISRAAVLEAIDVPDWKAFSDQYRGLVEDGIRSQTLLREPWWTEATAVGRPGFIETVKHGLLKDSSRRRLTISPASGGLVALRETVPIYGRSA